MTEIMHACVCGIDCSVGTGGGDLGSQDHYGKMNYELLKGNDVDSRFEWSIANLSGNPLTDQINIQRCLSKQWQLMLDCDDFDQ